MGRQTLNGFFINNSYKAVGKAMVERGTEHWGAQRRGTTARQALQEGTSGLRQAEGGDGVSWAGNARMRAETNGCMS